MGWNWRVSALGFFFGNAFVAVMLYGIVGHVPAGTFVFFIVSAIASLVAVVTWPRKLKDAK